MRCLSLLTLFLLICTFSVLAQENSMSVGSDAINPWDGDMMNGLEINRGEDTVTFSANGEVLETIPASELNYGDGIVGLRVTRLVNVSVSNFEIDSMN